MSTMDRRADSAEGLTLSATSPPSAVRVGLALAVSWVTMLAHNLYELPLAVGDLENSGPLVVALVLFVAYWRRGGSRAVQWALLGWALLNLAIGGVVTVLPLAVLPFDPEQSLSHYLAHVVYAVGQVPLVLVAVGALRRRPDRNYSR